MWAYLLKVAMTTTVIVVAAEIGKRSTSVGAMLVALPIMSMMAMILLYVDTKDMDRVATMAWQIPIAVIPTFAFFGLFVWLAKFELHFALVMLLSTLGMLSLYGVYLYYMK